MTLSRKSQAAAKETLVENMVEKNRSRFPIAVLLVTFFRDSFFPYWHPILGDSRSIFQLRSSKLMYEFLCACTYVF